MLEINGLHLAPQDRIPRSKKEGRDWLLSAAKFIYSSFHTSKTLFGTKDWDMFLLWRMYGNGNQPLNLYESWFLQQPDTYSASRIDSNGVDGLPTGGKDVVRGKRVYAKPSYEVVSPMPKIKSTIIAICENSDYEVRCDSTNPNHVKEKAETAYMTYYRTVFAKKEAKKYGVPFKRSMLEPRDEAQLQVMMQTGQFKLLFESSFQDMIEHTFLISNWKQIQQKTIEDGIDIGFKVGKRYTCPNTGATKVKYVDPTLYVMQWNSQHEGKAPTFCAHIEKMAMYQVQEMMLRDGYKKEDIVKVAKKYATGSDVNDSWWTERDTITNRWKWECLTVDVLEWEYMTIDEYRFDNKKDGYSEIAEPHHKPLDTFSQGVIYEGKYILGTDCVIDAHRAINNDGTFSYFWDRIPGQPITARCKSLLDDLMKSIIKQRNEITNAAPSGYYVDMAAITNSALSLGDQKEFVQQVIAAHKQTGVMTGQSITKGGKTTQDNPITPLKNGPQNLNEWNLSIATIFNQILDVAGVPAMLAATPTQDKGKAVAIAEQEIVSGNMALYTQKESLWRFKEAAAKCILSDIRYNIMFDPTSKSYYEGVIGKDGMIAVDAVGGISQDELSIALVSLPTKVERAELKASIREMAMSGSRDGLKTLTEPDIMFINRLIDSGKIEIAEIYASNVVAERLAEYAAKAPEADKRNAEAQQAANAMKIEAEMALIEKKLTLEGKIAENLLMQKSINDSQLLAQKIEGELRQIHAEGAIEAVNGRDIKNPRN